MKDNKVEVIIHSQLGFSEKKIIVNRKAEVQEVLNAYNRKGYRLISTTSPANNILYLFFEQI